MNGCHGADCFVLLRADPLHNRTSNNMELNKVDILVVFWASIMKCARVWLHTDQLFQIFLDVDLQVGGLHGNDS